MSNISGFKRVAEDKITKGDIHNGQVFINSSDVA
jgi:hypothetical protein